MDRIELRRLALPTLADLFGPEMSQLEIEYYAHVLEKMEEWQDDELPDAEFLCLLAGRA